MEKKEIRVKVDEEKWRNLRHVLLEEGKTLTELINESIDMYTRAERKDRTKIRKMFLDENGVDTTELSICLDKQVAFDLMMLADSRNMLVGDVVLVWFRQFQEEQKQRKKEGKAK